MGIGRGIWKLARPFVNFPRWMGARELLNYSQVIKRLFKNFFTVTRPKHVETFEQAVSRLRLTEADLQSRANYFFYFSLIYALIGLALLFYAVYLYLFYTHYGGFVSLMLSIIALLFAYRENFWWFQIKQRKLGCTFKEWLHYVLSRPKR